MPTTLLTTEQLEYWRVRLPVISQYDIICGCCGATAFDNATSKLPGYKYFSAAYGISLFNTVEPPALEYFMSKGGRWNGLDRCEHHFETVSLPEIGWSYHIVIQDGETPEPEDDEDDDY